MATFHPLDTESHSAFDYIAIAGEQVELNIEHCSVRFNLQTAEQLIDILGGYCEDRRRARADYYSEIDRIRDSIQEQKNAV